MRRQSVRAPTKNKIFSARAGFPPHASHFVQIHEPETGICGAHVHDTREHVRGYL